MLRLRDSVDAKMPIGATLHRLEASIVGLGGRIQVDHNMVTAGLFDMLGPAPTIGRTFREEENEPGHDRVVLLGDDVWRKLYDSDINVVGKTLMIKTSRTPFLVLCRRAFRSRSATLCKYGLLRH